MSVVAKPPGMSGDPFFGQPLSDTARPYVDRHGGTSGPYLSSDVIGSFLHSSSVCLNADLLDKEIERMKAEFGPQDGNPLPTPPLSVKSMSPVSSASPRSTHTVSTCSSSSLSDSGDEEALESDSFVTQLSMDVSSATGLFSDGEDFEAPRQAAAKQAPKRVVAGWSSSDSSSSDSSDSSSDSSDSSSSESEDDAPTTACSPKASPRASPKPTLCDSPKASPKRKTPPSSPRATQEKRSKKHSQSDSPTVNSLAVVSSLSAAIPRLPVSAMMGVVQIIDPAATAQEMDEFVVDLSSLDERKLLQLHTYVMEQIHQQITQLAAQQTKGKTGGKTMKRPRTDDQPTFGGKRPRTATEPAEKKAITHSSVSGKSLPGAGKKPRPHTGGKKPPVGKRPMAAVTEEPPQVRAPSPPRSTSPTQRARRTPNLLPQVRRTSTTDVAPAPPKDSTTTKRGGAKAKTLTKAAKGTAVEIPSVQSKAVTSVPKATQRSLKGIGKGGVPSKKGKKGTGVTAASKNTKAKSKAPVGAAPVIQQASAMWPTSLYTCDDDEDFVDVEG